MKNIFPVLLLLVNCSIQAQDLHFSQIAQTPLLINPASAGVFDGWQRVIINNRTQWMGSTTQFSTSNIAGDVTVGKKAMGNKGYLGIGALFNTDKGGDASFGTQTGSCTVSGILPTKAGHTFSTGIQAGFGSRKADISKLTFGNQWDNETFAFDVTLPTGEAESLNPVKYLDASAGFHYQYDGGKTTFARTNEFKIIAGAAVYHINTPSINFGTGTTDRLNRKYVFHTGLTTDLENSKFSIDAQIIQFIQGGHYQTILGSLIRYRIEEGTRLTGNSQNSYLGFGLYMRAKDAIIPMFLIDYRGFKCGLSYDITVSKLRKAYGGGSFEISLSFSNLNKGLMKAKR